MKKHLFFIILIIIASCKRDNSINQIYASDSETIQKAKLWYDSIHITLKKSHDAQTFGNLSIARLKAGGDPGIPNWSKAKVERQNNNITLTFLPYDSGTAIYHISKFGFRRLLIYTYEYGDNQSFWVEVNSDKPVNSENFTLKDFTGSVLVFDLNNNFLTGKRYLDGKWTADVYLGTEREVSTQSRILTQQSGKVKNANSLGLTKRTDGGGLICYDWYIRVCIPDINYCSEWRYDHMQCQYVEFGPGFSGGSSGGSSGGASGGGGTGSGSTGSGDHEPGSGGSIGVDNIGYTFPGNLWNGINGNKPLGEYPDICTGAQAIWNSSVQAQAEAIGLITMDNKFMFVAQVGYAGGSFGGLAIHQGQAYYTYPDNLGFPAYNYPGIIHSMNQYWIPVKGTVHTHNPCLQDGTDGITNFTLSQGDQLLAAKFTMLNHYIIGCGAVGQFNNGRNTPWVISSGNLSSTCSAIH
ncbi:hypothetical protein MUY27_06280 [Mucilaginibacter sp. RS28]|uniref:Uncharacterized protein n=1 Tax=Mucilaginibacter straminoryzae TaxID=2932774 RepID=A0A9X1X438_9SPHI|nr:hypothetical protein [Mucilaginibacter straminoryzae]MCJ8209308.1 hypothetical protein [Mucilaginibacter straminoryzae]